MVSQVEHKVLAFVISSRFAALVLQKVTDAILAILGTVIISTSISLVRSRRSVEARPEIPYDPHSGRSHNTNHQPNYCEVSCVRSRRNHAEHTELDHERKVN